MKIRRFITSQTKDELSDTLPRDELYQLLSCERRRYVLRYLQQSDGTGSLSDIAQQVTAWESGQSPEAVASSQYKSVRVSLYQYHLPKMADKGILEYDRATGQVTMTVDATGLDPFFLGPHSTRSLRTRHYTMVAVAGSLLAALSLGWFAPSRICLLSSYTVFALLLGVVTLSVAVGTKYRVRNRP